MTARFTSFIAFALALATLALGSCQTPTPEPQKPTTQPFDPNHHSSVLLDFETPETSLEWIDAQATQPDTRATSGSDGPATAPATSPAATAPASPIARSADRPNTGLWCVRATLSSHQQGEILHHFTKPMDLTAFDTLTAAVMHTAPAERLGEYLARAFIVDAHGKRAIGDPLPITGRWQDLLLNLKRDAADLDLANIAAIGIELHRNRSAPDNATPIDIQTDTWSASRDYRAYQGSRTANVGGGGLFVERVGTALHLGVPGQYEIIFYQRSGTSRPWFEVKQSSRIILGEPGTWGGGLMLLDQDRYDALGTVRQNAWDDKPSATGTSPQVGWPVLIDRSRTAKPSEETRWRWACAWTNPVAAIVEVKQEVGPYDRIGEPAVQLTWRFMIYQWGQAFVHAQWTRSQASPQPHPITWALVQTEASNLEPDPSLIHAKTPADADRLLNAVYPVSIRDGLQTALPHQMQRRAAIAMIAKSGTTASGIRDKNLWWWARTPPARRVFGTGLAFTTADTGAADCMLLLNKPTALMQAGSFAQYLVPPKIKVRQGELDRNFPGDADNDGLVDSYGFQVIRLANGRATFMVYPQERPLFYPPYLFTVPAIERDKVNLRNSRLLINLDGKQFADPPQFPDGSFLLQLPYIIDRPVQVEAVLVPK